MILVSVQYAPGSSQLSVNSGHNYEGKGHFSCSGRHPNELVATYLTRLSKPLGEIFRLPLTARFASPANWICFFFVLLPVSGAMTAHLGRNFLDARAPSKRLFITKIITPQKVMPWKTISALFPLPGALVTADATQSIFNSRRLSLHPRGELYDMKMKERFRCQNSKLSVWKKGPGVLMINVQHAGVWSHAAAAQLLSLTVLVQLYCMWGWERRMKTCQALPKAAGQRRGSGRLGAHRRSYLASLTAKRSPIRATATPLMRESAFLPGPRLCFMFAWSGGGGEGVGGGGRVEGGGWVEAAVILPASQSAGAPISHWLLQWGIKIPKHKGSGSALLWMSELTSESDLSQYELKE